LLAALDHALQNIRKKPGAPPLPRLKQTLAGAVVSLSGGRIVIAAAPPRRHREG
jgi:tRNA(Ile)-lysidine synthase